MVSRPKLVYITGYHASLSFTWKLKHKKQQQHDAMTRAMLPLYKNENPRSWEKIQGVAILDKSIRSTDSHSQPVIRS